MKNKNWFLYAAITTIFWGIWGSFIEIPEKAGFPATLGYSVWALTMIPCSLIALYLVGWKLEYDVRSIFLGSLAGLLGAGGQLILFQALREGPAYVVELSSHRPLLTGQPVLVRGTEGIVSGYGLVVEVAPDRWLNVRPALGTRGEIPADQLVAIANEARIDPYADMSWLGKR